METGGCSPTLEHLSAPKGILRPCPSPAGRCWGAARRRVSFSGDSSSTPEGESHESFPPCALGTLTPSRLLGHALLEGWGDTTVEMGLSTVASPPKQSAFVVYSDRSPHVRDPESAHQRSDVVCTIPCVGRIHEEEDLLDAPRHVTVISPIRSSCARDCVQYEPRMPTAQMVARHLSCVGQIHEEEADEAQFWGRDSPTMRMSPVRKRLHPSSAKLLAHSSAIAEEEEEDNGLASRLKLVVRTMTCVGRIHEEEDLLDATPQQVMVISPIRSSCARDCVRYEPRMPTAQMVARHLSCVGQIHEEDTLDDVCVVEMSMEDKSTIVEVHGSGDASDVHISPGAGGVRTTGPVEQLQQLTAAEVRAVAFRLAAPELPGPQPSAAAMHCEATFRDALSHAEKADCCSPLWRSLLQRLLQTSCDTPVVPDQPTRTDAPVLTGLPERLQLQEERIASLEQRQWLLEMALQRPTQHVGERQTEPPMAPAVLATSHREAVMPSPRAQAAPPTIADDRHGRRAPTSDVMPLALTPTSYHIAVHSAFHGSPAHLRYAERTHHVASHTPSSSLGLVPLERNSWRHPPTGRSSFGHR
eukprot:GGOE01006402.1.p1 GENE.GGOE01006402.1~~GGOE01006402.1.p1  ORF type:complete len:633 (-),score=99.02 GGOE01006402.1:732-2486(-)